MFQLAHGFERVMGQFWWKCSLIRGKGKVLGPSLLKEERTRAEVKRKRAKVRREREREVERERSQLNWEEKWWEDSNFTAGK